MVSLATTEPCPCCGGGPGAHPPLKHQDKSATYPPACSPPPSAPRTFTFGGSPSGSVPFIPTMLFSSSYNHKVVPWPSTPPAPQPGASPAASPSKHIPKNPNANLSLPAPSATFGPAPSSGIGSPSTVFGTSHLAAGLPQIPPSRSVPEPPRSLSGGGGMKASGGSSAATATMISDMLGAQHGAAVVAAQPKASCVKECCYRNDEEDEEEKEEEEYEEEAAEEEGVSDQEEDGGAQPAGKQGPTVIRISLTCTCGREQKVVVQRRSAGQGRSA